MKREVGMYVRTKSFKGFPSKIGKITKIEYNAGIDNETYIALDNDEEKCRRWTEDWLIGKPSFNPVDLIEVGDYVNGSRVMKTNCKLEYIDDDSDTGVNEVYDGLELENGWIYFEHEIESIVTKEQFESIKYSLEG